MQKQTQRKRHFGWSRRLGLALGALLTLAAGAPAQAFNYTTGDLIGIYVDGSTELIVNLGSLASLADGASFSFATPAGFGADGATGAKFLAYQTAEPFTGSLGRNITFTVEDGADPTSFDANISGYVTRIGLAQSDLDDGGASDKFLELLRNFPLPPTGGVITNTANVLALLTSNPASYSSVLGLNGTVDNLNNRLPFDNDNLVGASTQIALWTAVRTATLTSTSTLAGLLTVEGNIGGGTTRITFSAPVPEPGTLLLFGAGLGGLALIGRRRDH